MKKIKPLGAPCQKPQPQAAAADLSRSPDALALRQKGEKNEAGF